MGFQGIPQHGKFAWSGVEQAVEEVINLGGIDGEEGKAGVELLAGRVCRFADCLLQFGVGPTAISGHRADDLRHLSSVGIRRRSTSPRACVS